MYMPAKVHHSISWLISDHDARNRSYQELMHAYLHLSADRLADATPCYLDIWHSYVPSMAFGTNGSLGLLNALCALAAFQIAPLQYEPERGRERALGHYITALRHHHDPDNLFAPRLDEAVLATALVFAHYEVLNCRGMLIVGMERRDSKNGTTYARIQENHHPTRQRSISNTHRTSLILLLPQNRHAILCRHRQPNVPRRKLVEERSIISHGNSPRSTHPPCRRCSACQTLRHRR